MKNFEPFIHWYLDYALSLCNLEEMKNVVFYSFAFTVPNGSISVYGSNGDWAKPRRV